jgi:Mrp family chromosome partitioning ATPase
MNDHEPGSDFILSAISRARAERAARHKGGAEAAPAQPVNRTGHWDTLPAFAPDPRHLESRLVRTLHAGSDAKPFDIIRTKLLHQMRSNNWRRIAFASPDSGCGKTLLTLNLALSMARQPDLAVMAMELDMRRPTMARTLGLKSGQQFSEVLAGRAAAADQLSRVGTNLALATNARPEPAAAELLAGRGAAHVIDRMEADFAPDVILFDLPPLLMTDDAMAFMDQIDCVLLVAAAERNTMAQITRCAEDLAARCNFLGVILNKCRFLPTDERYGYGEGYGD